MYRRVEVINPAPGGEETVRPLQMRPDGSIDT
jgi:hypothetical protein